jgi:hypothetical protein
MNYSIFADATTGPGVWQLAEHFSFVATIAACVIMWLTFRRKKESVVIRDQPVKTRRVEPNVKEPACIERRAVLEKQLRDLDGYTKHEVGRLHDKIDEVEARFDDNLRVGLAAVNETLREMPGEIVKLINEASAGKSKNP